MTPYATAVTLSSSIPNQPVAEPSPSARCSELGERQGFCGTLRPAAMGG